MTDSFLLLTIFYPSSQHVSDRTGSAATARRRTRRDEVFRDLRMRRPVRVNIRGDHDAAPQSFSKWRAAPSWGDAIDPLDRIRRWGIERRVAKLMAPPACPTGAQKGWGKRFDFSIADRLQALVHGGDSGNQPGQWKGYFVERADTVAEIHQAAAFRIDRSARGREISDRFDHRSIR